MTQAATHVTEGSCASAQPKILLWGGGSQARLIEQMIIEAGLGEASIIFDAHIMAPRFASHAMFVNDIVQLRDFLGQLTHFIVCIGADHGYARVRISEYLHDLGLVPLSVAHSTSQVDSGTSIGIGCQFMPKSFVHKFSSVGDFSILNTSAIVDHECVIGRGVHVMGSAAIAGRVSIGNYATIGTNATVIPDIFIGEGAYVGAGAVVTRDVAPYTVVTGVPAKPMRKIESVFNEEFLDKMDWHNRK